ncbi:hypothetical protein LVY72_11520 [Arthrobacter sp. I2-34]|uniref:Uncharacterized protein n=1 Tax=Arthrobacter hankyongi TaxID=2904801 RepID=A0ABS9L789_9MICC|nr:hypothetical protein [Arthrobacter hankyongi]MCG2622541.1 hypothetical protein [Arthrobacter hankyongi]
MRQNLTAFSMTVAPRKGAEHIFRSSVEHLAANGVGNARFSVVELTDSRAVLRGEITGDPRLVTDRSLAEFLTDTLAVKEGIHLDLEVRIEAWPLPAGAAGAVAA